MVSALVSLTLTPMMGSRFLASEAYGHGRQYNFTDKIFTGMIRFYERTLNIALRFRFVTLMVFVATVQGSFQGTAQAFQSSLSTPPYLVAVALVAVYIILGVLYESYILPLTILPSAGVGALLMLMLMMFGYQLTVIALIGFILLISIVKKNGIMMVGFDIIA